MLIVGWWQPEPLCLADTIASVILAQPPDAQITSFLFGWESIRYRLQESIICGCIQKSKFKSGKKIYFGLKPLLLGIVEQGWKTWLELWSSCDQEIWTKNIIIRGAIPEQIRSFFWTLFKRGGGQNHVQKFWSKFCMILKAFWQRK